MLDPRRSSNLSLVRDNVHTFEAGSRGARILDFILRVAGPREPRREGLYLDVAPRPLPGGDRCYAARQIASPYA